MIQKLAIAAAAAGATVGVGAGVVSTSGGGAEQTVEERVTAVVSTFDCPDGDIIGSVRAGDRVYGLAQSADGDWWFIRDPRDVRAAFWVPAPVLEPDANRQLPVADCGVDLDLLYEPVAVTFLDPTSSVPTSTTTSTRPETTTTAVPTTVPQTTTTTGTQPPVVEPPVEPEQPLDPVQPEEPVEPEEPLEPPEPPEDTEAPAIGGVDFVGFAQTECRTPLRVTVTASDNVGVASLAGSYSDFGGSPIVFTPSSGDQWVGQFLPTNVPQGFLGGINVTLAAVDDAGNQSSVVRALPIDARVCVR